LSKGKDQEHKVQDQASGMPRPRLRLQTIIT